ncbi:type I-F CRISPR-associated helicase Cas3f [Isoalcanivorax beigongshangi]|uniref:Type I-F CRISPR-associated helicase Cas3f n=1 Tax=Isoalcanivorax beigongshangi TaxID=3238810 RepID=A0ABV4AKH8_9GAMM
MNILLISQCDKRALTETRRLIDQFAERRGDRTWQTPITQEGLRTLRRLLRKTARKNTAVACHWLRGHDHSELLWIVGDARRFNAEGAVPTHRTGRDVLRRDDENTWHHLPLMQALTALAALLHDVGKATEAFQQMLTAAMGGVMPGTTHYRHEWVSVRLFQAFVGGDDDAAWLQRLVAAASRTDDGAWLSEWLSAERLQCDGLPSLNSSATRAGSLFDSLPPLAQAVAWLVLTHHRLPALPVRRSAQAEQSDSSRSPFLAHGARPDSLNPEQLSGLLAQIDADWNQPPQCRGDVDLGAYWRFPHGLPVTDRDWRKQAARQAKALLPWTQRGETWLQDPFVMHVSRLCLMLSDHYYSSLTFERSAECAAWQPAPERQRYLKPQARLQANTARCDGQYRYNQTLDEHLLGVHATANRVVHGLPSLVRSLPALQRHRGLSRRTTREAFRWQDKAVDLARSVRERTVEQGAFIVNMASTGCGKTLANARIMYALAEPTHGLRCAFAIGLRTLTQQTGRSFQRDLTLDDDELAILVGGAASRALFEHHETKEEARGSASRQALLDEDSHVLYEGDDRHPLLQRLTRDARSRRLIAAPVLVCTVDHLTPATESLRGGRHIAPMLRLLTGDLVLDEPDDFDLDDLPALTRLVHWAGLLGARVLLSSATLPPALVQGLFQAYCDGRTHWQHHRAQRPNELLRIPCLWVDEFSCRHAECSDEAVFLAAHDSFAEARIRRLAAAPVRRIAELLPVDFGAVPKAERPAHWAALWRDAALRLHRDPQNHNVDPASGKRVSFGLIRMANIGPLYKVAQALFVLGVPQGIRVHLCVYHSQFPLFLRSAIEHRLDTALDRRRSSLADPDPVFSRAQVRQALDAHPEPDQLFVVLGSPVTEVGRDHDYDWAVVEPSSMRSLIQLAGRVRRHRPGPVDRTNVLVADHNVHFFERSDVKEAVYCRPGFEDVKRCQANSPERSARYPNFHLSTHSLRELLADQLDQHGRWVLDASPRLRLPQGRRLMPTGHLADLEHARLRHAMRPTLPGQGERAQAAAPWMLNASSHWNVPLAWLSGVLPQAQRFRHDSTARCDAVMLPNDDEDALLLHRLTGSGRRRAPLYTPEEESCWHLPDEVVAGPGIAPWGQVDPLAALAELAEARGEDLRRCAESFATVSLPRSEQGWWFHPVLGFCKKG